MINPDQALVPFGIAHRGACAIAPENTLSAFRRAAELGLTWIELDTNCSRDGMAFVFHDDTLDRCSDGHGYFIHRNASEITALDAGQWFDETFRDEKIPTLAQAMLLSRELKLGVNVEIKCTHGWEQASARAAARVLKNFPDVPMIISSFSMIALEEIKTLLPNRARSYLCTMIPEDWPHRLERTGSTGLHCQWAEILNPETVKTIQNAGYAVRSYTVNEAEDILSAKKMGLDSVFTNYPDRILNVENQA